MLDFTTKYEKPRRIGRGFLLFISWSHATSDNLATDCRGNLNLNHGLGGLFQNNRLLHPNILHGAVIGDVFLRYAKDLHDALP